MSELSTLIPCLNRIRDLLYGNTVAGQGEAAPLNVTCQ